MKITSVPQIVAAYDTGYLNASDTATHLLGAITRECIDEEMASIPEEVMSRFRRLVQGYNFGRMILIGPDTEPTKAQIAMIREWFARHPQIAAQPLRSPSDDRVKVAV